MLAIVLSSLAVLAGPDPVEACSTRLLAYAGWSAGPDEDWRLQLDAPSGGRLDYFGATHSRDPDDPQFRLIEAGFAALRPTVVFYEGPDRGVGSTAEDTIATRGESGFVRHLAAGAGARAVSLEPSPAAQVAGLVETWPADQVFLFFVLRESARLRDREDLRGSALDGAVASLLSRAAAMARSAGLTPPFEDLAGLEAAYRVYWAEGPDWRAAPSAWFDPLADDAGTGGRFMAAINAASSELRNRHMHRVLAEAVLSGERVFAVVGRNHVPMQAEALRCALAAS